MLVAALGSALVFLYTKGADTRAQQKFDTVQVLEATAVINPGEKIEDAQAAGKLAMHSVMESSLLDGYQTTTDSLTGTVALGTIYPGEQIISAKFGTSAAVQSSLQIPDGMMAISVNLTDPARVAGFVSPGANVAIFVGGQTHYVAQNGAQAPPDTPFTQLLLDKVLVLGVGSTTPVSTTTTDESGSSTTENLPRTLLTIAVTQDQAQKVMYASGNGDLSFALLTDSSQVAPSAPTTFDNLFTAAK